MTSSEALAMHGCTVVIATPISTSCLHFGWKGSCGVCMGVCVGVSVTIALECLHLLGIL